MAPGQDVALARDMTFENIMHKKTATTHEGFSAMLNKDKEAQQAAVNEYFQHWDNKEAKNETDADRAVSPAPTKQILATLNADTKLQDRPAQKTTPA
jgi:hypothetical protein